MSIVQVDKETGEVVESPEIYALDLDQDLIFHLANPDSVYALQSERVSARLLEDNDAVAVFEWQMDHIRQNGTPASATVLADEFDEIDFQAPVTAVSELIGRLRARYVKNHSRDAVRKMHHLANEAPMTVGSEMMRMGRELAELTMRRGETYSDRDWNRAVAHYNEMQLRGAGPSLGYSELDEHFNGILGVTFLIAPPKTYKSWYSVNSFRANIFNQVHCCYYTLELPAVDVEWRLACMVNDVPYWKYLKGAIDPQEQRRMNENMKLLQDSGAKWEIEKPPPGERSTSQLIERALNRDAKCVFIDQLQYMENAKGQSLGSTNNTGDYWEVCNTLRDYSDEIPIFVVHQFNRSVMNAQELPEMQQVKGSASIEEVGTLLLGIWANKEMRQNNMVEIGTMASRHFGFNAWSLGVNLSNGCGMTMLGEVEDIDE